MKNDKVIISLIIVVLITIVSVPSALAYFSTYTQTKGTKTLSFNYDTKLEESIDNNNKTISVTATGDPVFVRVRYYAIIITIQNQLTVKVSAKKRLQISF